MSAISHLCSEQPIRLHTTVTVETAVTVTVLGAGQVPLAPAAPEPAPAAEGALPEPVATGETVTWLVKVEVVWSVVVGEPAAPLAPAEAAAAALTNTDEVWKAVEVTW